MNISTRWIKEILPIQASPTEIADALSVSGLEVEHIEDWESLKGGLKGFVTGEVLTCEQHPDADRLKVTTVNIGGENPLHIVCGAPNVAAGQKVIVATVGSWVYLPEKEPFEIRKAKIRGQISEGMICAEDEMGVGNSHDGILVLDPNTEVGIPASDFFGVESDTVLEIGLTANRGDAASHVGVARDIAALFNIELNQDTIGATEIPSENVRQIKIENPQKCNRYIGITLNGITVSESPKWLQNRLKAIGIEPKNNIVDATNYILHHYGQPVHAFDADKLSGSIEIRQAKSSEKITLLDGKEVELHLDDIVIADEKAPIAIAGVMGGKESAVSESTKNVFLEIAHFHAASVRKTAKRHVIHTDAAFRFEREIDLVNIGHVGKALTGLVLELVGGAAVGCDENYPNPYKAKQINITIDKLNTFAGMEYSKAQVLQILKSLKFEVSEVSGQLEIVVPSWKNDVSEEVDIYEEIMRIVGYDAIPMTGKMQVSMGSFGGMERKQKENKIREHLISLGFYEASNNSLTSADWYNSDDMVFISNPLSSDMAIMRQSQIPGLLQNIAFNQNRQAQRVRLFEIGKTYKTAGSGFKETPVLTIVAWGDNQEESWENKSEKTNFFDIKAAVQSLLARIDSSYNLSADDIQLVSKKWLKKADVNGSVWAVELPLKKLIKAARKDIQYQEPSRFFENRRDLSLVVEKSVSFESIEKTIHSQKMKHLQKVNVFDIYEGKPLEDNQKSISISLHFQRNDSTVNEAETDKSMEKLMQTLESQGAIIRR